MGFEIHVRLQRLSDYRGCQITEVVRLQRLSDYRGCQITEVVRLQRTSDYRGRQITEVVRLQRLSDYRGCRITEDVRLQRLSDYPVSLSTVKHGDCPSESGQIRENVGLLRCWITEVLLYKDRNQ